MNFIDFLDNIGRIKNIVDQAREVKSSPGTLVVGVLGSDNKIMSNVLIPSNTPETKQIWAVMDSIITDAEKSTKILCREFTKTNEPVFGGFLDRGYPTGTEIINEKETVSVDLGYNEPVEVAVSESTTVKVPNIAELKANLVPNYGPGLGSRPPMSYMENTKDIDFVQ